MTGGELRGFDLEPLAREHLEAVFALHADPRVWTHLPSGRHTDPARSLLLIEHAERSRSRTGLGPWAVVEHGTGRLAGTAGAGITDLDVWNLGYRFHPDFQGRGLARAAADAAIAAARGTREEVPVVARMLETNPASIGLAERLGLTLVWHGATRADDGAAATRRIYADRPLDAALIARLAALG